MLGVIIVAVVSYLAGAITFSYLAGRLFAGIDLREHGSGNLGATNVFRFLGVRIAVVVLIADIAKGFLPVFFAPDYSARFGQTVPVHWLMLIAGFFAVIGHMFSVFVRFRGGKGIATTAGAFLALSPVSLSIAFVVWVGVVVATRIVSLGSIVAAVALPAIVYLSGRTGLTTYHWSLLALSFAIALVVLVKHKSNIRRLMAGEEPVLRRHKGHNHVA